MTTKIYSDHSKSKVSHVLEKNEDGSYEMRVPSVDVEEAKTFAARAYGGVPPTAHIDPQVPSGRGVPSSLPRRPRPAPNAMLPVLRSPALSDDPCSPHMCDHGAVNRPQARPACPEASS
eukprot:gene3902-4275_t